MFKFKIDGTALVKLDLVVHRGSTIIELSSLRPDMLSEPLPHVFRIKRLRQEYTTSRSAKDLHVKNPIQSSETFASRSHEKLLLERVHRSLSRFSDVKVVNVDSYYKLLRMVFSKSHINVLLSLLVPCTVPLTRRLLKTIEASVQIDNHSRR